MTLKKCPFCAELIQDEAVYCKHCKNTLSASNIKVTGHDARAPNESTRGGVSGFIAFIVVCAILATTNPNKRDFTEYATNEIFNKINRAGDFDNEFSAAMAKGLTEIVLDNSLRESNYLIFSTYTIDLHLLRIFNPTIKDIKFLAIAGQFIPLDVSTLNQIGAQNTVASSTKQKSESDSNQPTENPRNTIMVFQNTELNNMLVGAYNSDKNLIATEVNTIAVRPKPPVGNKPEARKYNSDALNEMQAGNYTLAEDLFAYGYKLNPADAEIVNNLAYVQIKEGKFDDAIYNLENTLLISSNRSAAWFNLYELLAIKGDSDINVCASYALGLKYSKNKDKAIDYGMERINQENDYSIKRKLQDGLECGKSKSLD